MTTQIVLLFGTFDGIHEGHRNLFAQARAFGDSIHVIVARDATVQQVKGRKPRATEQERLAALKQEPGIAHAHLGALGDKYAALQTIRPHVIALGYDQEAFTERLQTYCAENLPSTRIVRLEPYHADRYKSSLLQQFVPPQQ